MAELGAALHPDPDGVFLFVSDDYDLDALGREIRSRFGDTPVIGCTTAGQIGASGLSRGGACATSFSGGLHARSFLIDPLADPARAAATMLEEISASGVLEGDPTRLFATVLIDGLSMREERLVAAVHELLPAVPLVGASAGDSLRFERTGVYWDGELRSGCAVLTLFESEVPFAPIKFQHHVPTDERLVVTGADPERRTVYELNGLPAVEAYAEAIGRRVDELGPGVFGQHPLMLRIGQSFFTRSIQEVAPDGSLPMFCAIEEGLVLRVGRTERVLESIDAAFTAASERVGEPSLILGFDCVLRRLEYEELGLLDEVGRRFVRWNVSGFSTYGEQYNGVHINQTFTGIAIGGAG